jgi:hypothetical protein
MIVSTGWKLEELLLGESNTHDEQNGLILWKWMEEYQQALLHIWRWTEIEDSSERREQTCKGSCI